MGEPGAFQPLPKSEKESAKERWLIGCDNWLLSLKYSSVILVFGGQLVNNQLVGIYFKFSQVWLG